MFRLNDNEDHMARLANVGIKREPGERRLPSVRAESRAPLTNEVIKAKKRTTTYGRRRR